MARDKSRAHIFQGSLFSLCDSPPTLSCQSGWDNDYMRGGGRDMRLVCESELSAHVAPGDQVQDSHTSLRTQPVQVPKSQ